MCFALKLKRKGPLKVCMIGMQGNTCASVASKERVEETVVSALTWCISLYIKYLMELVDDSFTSLFVVFDSFAIIVF